MHTKTWTVPITITEEDGVTHAIAHLHTEPGATRLAGRGIARLGRKDSDIPEIGDELAVSRALADLARQLLGTTSDDISDATHEDVFLDH